MAKYDPLKHELTRDGRLAIVMTFAEIERLVGPLPPTSHANQCWWGNAENHVRFYAQCKAWAEAGYCASADLQAHTVTFQRRRATAR